MSDLNGIPASYDADLSDDPRDTPEQQAQDDAQLDEWKRRQRVWDALDDLAEDIRDLADEVLDDEGIEIGPHWFEFQWAKIGEAWGKIERAALQGKGSHEPQDA